MIAHSRFSTQTPEDRREWAGVAAERGLRGWTQKLEWEPVGRYFASNPAMLAAVAFATGVVLGWLVKRR